MWTEDELKWVVQVDELSVDGSKGGPTRRVFCFVLISQISFYNYFYTYFYFKYCPDPKYSLFSSPSLEILGYSSSNMNYNPVNDTQSSSSTTKLNSNAILPLRKPIAKALIVSITYQGQQSVYWDEHMKRWGVWDMSLGGDHEAAQAMRDLLIGHFNSLDTTNLTWFLSSR